MAISNIWRMHSVRIDRATDLVFGAMNSVAMSTDSEVVREVNSSRLFPYQNHLNFRSAQISFTTWDLAQSLGAIGVQGMCIGKTPNDAIFINLARYDCNTIVDFTTYEVKKGIIFPTTLTIDHQGNAQISYNIIAVADGTNDPVIKATGVAAGAPNLIVADTEDLRWTLYETWVNAIQLLQKKSVSIDFGIQVSTDGSDSEIFDSFATIDQIMPTMTVQGINPNYLANFVSPTSELAGDAVTGGEDLTRVSLKRRDQLIATSSHVLVDFWGLSRVTDPFSSTGNNAGTTDLRVECNQVGTNAPLVVAVDAAIPA